MYPLRASHSDHIQNQKSSVQNGLLGNIFRYTTLSFRVIIGWCPLEVTESRVSCIYEVVWLTFDCLRAYCWSYGTFGSFSGALSTDLTSFQ